MKNAFHFIAPYFDAGGSKASRLISYTGLAVGITLLLCSVQMYINVDRLIHDKTPRKNGYDFISVTKNVTNENMGKENRFSEQDIAEMSKQPFLSGVAPLLSNQFRAKASAGNIIPFSTDLFLESIDKSFIDTVPPSFSWQPGQQDVPIIFSADFLEMYNVFAPAQGLPQLSGSSIGAVSIQLECYGPLGIPSTFRGHIVALSDRINSVLVPPEFLTWANHQFGNSAQTGAARVYIKTSDANDPQLMSYLEKNDYRVNKERTRFGRVKQILQGIISGLGAFAVLVILLAIMLFSFYLQLMIARSRENLQLLLTLGYSPSWLSSNLAKKWIPVYLVIVLVALIIASGLQYWFWSSYTAGADQLSPFLHPFTLVLAVLLLGLCILVNRSLIRKLLFRMS